MNKDRLEQLLGFLAEDPNDPFTLYALALEYRHFDDAKSMEYFNELLSNHPDYIGTYYHAAELFQALGDKQKAEETYRSGLALASNLNDRKALQELQNAYNQFKMEDLL
jgi:Tfp pilus assembly protein PilF